MRRLIIIQNYSSILSGKDITLAAHSIWRMRLVVNDHVTDKAKALEDNLCNG